MECPRFSPRGSSRSWHTCGHTWSTLLRPRPVGVSVQRPSSASRYSPTSLHSPYPYDGIRRGEGTHSNKQKRSEKCICCLHPLHLALCDHCWDRLPNLVYKQKYLIKKANESSSAMPVDSVTTKHLTQCLHGKQLHNWKLRPVLDLTLTLVFCSRTCLIFKWAYMVTLYKLRLPFSQGPQHDEQSTGCTSEFVPSVLMQ